MEDGEPGKPVVCAGSSGVDPPGMLRLATPAPLTCTCGPAPLLASASRCRIPASFAGTSKPGDSDEVMLSELLTPVSLAACRSGAGGGAGATVSIVTVSGAESCVS